MNEQNRKINMSQYKLKRLAFYILMMALPILQFVIFYIYVNFNSFAMAFQQFNYATGNYDWAGFANFDKLFYNFKEQAFYGLMVKNSLNSFFWTTLVGSGGAIIFSHYIYKSKKGSTFFKVILYMPHIVSNVVFVIMYKYFIDVAVPELWFLLTGEEIVGLLANPDTVWTMLVVFTVWVSFGGQVLLYSAAMNGISDSIIESAMLDGVGPIKELVLIVIPCIWSVFVTFMITNIVGIFTGQLSLFTFYGVDAERGLYTIGYFLYAEAKKGQFSDYPYLSAVGLLCTAIAVPTTLGIKKLLNTVGPSFE